MKVPNTKKLSVFEMMNMRIILIWSWFIIWIKTSLYTSQIYTIIYIYILIKVKEKM